MAGVRIKDLATRSSKLTSGDAYIPVDNGGSGVDKVEFETLAQQVLEDYEGSELAGSEQSVKDVIDSMSSVVNGLMGAVGSPLVASTVAGMTDQTKIYVYTGSETGYTAGNWYYYDGSAWTSGGVYNATAAALDDYIQHNAVSGKLELTEGLVPAPGNSDALVGAHDVKMDQDDTRLDDAFTDLKGAIKDYSTSVGLMGYSLDFNLTGASTQNQKFYFDETIPAGKYRVRLKNYTGRMYMNAVDSSGTVISDRMDYWDEGIVKEITTSTDIGGIAIYTISGWSPTAKTVTVIFERFGDYSNTVHSFGTELKREISHSYTSGTTLNETTSFIAALPAGVYSVTLGSFEGECYVSLKHNSDILNRWYEWSPNKKRTFYSDVTITGIAVYMYQPASSGTLSVTVERVAVDKSVHSLIDFENNSVVNPIDYGCVTGEGTSSSPYVSPDGTGGIYETIKAITDGKGTGRVRLPVGCYNISKSFKINSNCLRLTGDVWNYPGRPNGVYESNDGTKLKSIDNVPLINYASGNGTMIEHIGFVGSVSNGYTVGLFDRENPHENVGVDFTASYCDQFTFRNLSFTGLGAAICASTTEDGYELDAFTFKDLNTDGCNIGIIFDNVTTFYSKIQGCIIADTPAYGLFLGAPALGVVISDNMFVRNCGKMSDDQKTQFTNEGICAVYIGDGRNLTFANNQIHKAGTFYNVSDPENRYYEYDDSNALYLNGNDCEIIGNNIVSAESYGIVVAGARHNVSGNNVRCDSGICVKSDYTLITDNAVSIAGGQNFDAIVIEGDYNSVTGNYTTGTIRVSGDYNIIIRCGFEKVVVEAGATGNTLIGFDSSAITDNGTNTVIK